MTSNAEIEAAEIETCRLSERPVGINPLLYPGWDFLVSAHPGSSFFHRTAWERVLHETYGHLPIYFCRFANGQLKELFPIMEISSPWTGRRGVSLPFTDACLPLQTTKHDHRALYELALEHGRRQNWRSLECRSNDPAWQGASPSLAFYGHTIDLKHGREALFKSFKGAVRRGIRKAARTGLRVEFSNGLDSIRTFYVVEWRSWTCIRTISALAVKNPACGHMRLSCTGVSWNMSVGDMAGAFGILCRGNWQPSLRAGRRRLAETICQMSAEGYRC
jgi:hypothetical protein